MLKCIKGNSLCGCQSCRVTKLVKEHNLCDCDNCSTKEEDNNKKDSNKEHTVDEDEVEIYSHSAFYNQDIHLSTNDTDLEDVVNIPTSEDDSREEDQPGEGEYCDSTEENNEEDQTEDEDDDETVSPDTSDNDGMHTSGADTDSEADINLLTSEDDRGTYQSGGNDEHNNPNTTRYKDSTLQETVNRQDGARH